MSRVLTVLALTLALLPSTPARAADPFTGFRSVLAQGEGQTATATDLTANQANGTVPNRFVDQQPLYVGIMPRAAGLTTPDLDVFYKRTDFGALPGGVGSSYSPRPGVTITRDARFGVAHINGVTREDVMFGAGYATAEERLFLMDALRHTAKGTLAGLTGASAARDDADQLLDQDFSDAEMEKQFNDMPARLGPDGARAKADVLAYIAGINQRITDVTNDPSLLPAEYPALGTMPAKWTVSDTVAEAILLVTRFTVSNGGEETNILLQQAFRGRFGSKWRTPYRDFREQEDPEAFTVAKDRHPSDRPGKVKHGLNALLDYGSVRKRDAIVQGPSGDQRAPAPSWVAGINGLNRRIPHEESNAVLVAARRSKSGHALGAMGPQVDYYSPQIFSEYELHGGGIDVSGVSFPGASPWPLIGHGIDFAWSGTSANGDNQDTFVEKLCNPDGSAPDRASTYYVYKGQCRPFVIREQAVTTPYSAATAADQPPQTIKYRAMRSVHGPIFGFAAVDGAPVALARAKGVDFHELDAVLAFMKLAENRPTDPKSFMDVMGTFPGTENWFYVDDKNIAFQQSGLFARHAKGSDVDRPFWGDGRADWQGFDPDTYTFKTIPPAHRPRAVNPKDGFIISWNNKEAPGWVKGPTEWGDGPVHRALLLQRRLKTELKSGAGKTDLTGLTRAVNLAATTDLRAAEVYPWMRRAIGKVSGEDAAQLAKLDAWVKAGAQRLDSTGDNVYEHSDAIALMDAWWPRAVTAAFEPALGKELFALVRDRVLGLGGFGAWGWASHMQKDLRRATGRRVPGHSRLYCGSGKRAACRAALLTSLREAAADLTKRLGAEPKLRAVCPDAPRTCDQIVPETAGAIDTPAFPWQNRGTFHQVTEVSGHR